MNKRKNAPTSIIKVLLLLGVVFISGTNTMAQLGIKGPGCVIAAVEYQYLVTGKPDSILKMRVCVTGGIFARNGQTCTGDTMLTELRIIWSDSVGGTIHLYTASGDITKKVSLTRPLQAGKIDSVVSVQIVKSNSIPVSITCTAASGGGCAPIYVYQWQKSGDGIEWSDINAGNGQHFRFASTLPQTTFYRRKVVESNSGTIAYSLVAAVFVEPVNQ